MNLEIQVNPKILELVASIEKDLTKAINEALTLWLRKRLIVCPITGQFCNFNNGSCNDCTAAKNNSLKRKMHINRNKQFSDKNNLKEQT